MGFYQGNDFRKISGGMKGKARDKKKRELGSSPTYTVLSDEEVRIKERTMGGNTKVKLRYAIYANVVDPSTNTAKKVKVMGVISTPANKELARRRIIIKGSRINTEIGEALVTSSPGQDGVINAVLIKQ
ncbi:30S ribosomal protein S8e [Sulfuracidifex metallicus]|jgi:small subunit ribosomal protein S8e|uniref:Small ribosomal subunit protein eS8 n=1 Tax=Sulfuracidifex metallicus DSM 6482 = JCM 9184 TaxID=523847 RepID=A0A6A9QN88_SULME|nr:30S ribosomal protein S8e [Sulfuracidifex metallicus]MUN28735.1 30S ribosomal protein S8e [Sulfuracidifex metallicus DSM 6482 = JCM 9184]WOE50746.1 30S ribosomal protein S8e [Sulfuracidifex metallicus DSM 6482 = JCM 9184]